MLINDFWAFPRPSPFKIPEATGPQVALSRVMDRARLGIPITVVVDSDWTVIAGAGWARAMAAIPHSEEMIEGIQAKHYTRTTSILRILDGLSGSDRRKVEVAQRDMWSTVVHVLRAPPGYVLTAADLAAIVREIDGMMGP